MFGTGREGSGSGQRQSSPRAAVLTRGLEKKIAVDQPMECYVVTYNVNRELQTYRYQPSREYTY